MKDFSIKENQERANYLEAQEAVASKGINYRELFVVNERRKERLERAEKLDKKHKNYTLQTISNPTHALSMLDFIVVDGVYVLLSHIDASHEKAEQNFVFVKNELLASVFKDLFEVCWTRARAEQNQIALGK